MTFEPQAEDRVLGRVRERVVAAGTSTRRRRKARRATAIVVGIATVTVLSGSYLVMHASKRDIERTAVCYWTASLDARSTSVQVVDSATSTRSGETNDEPTADPIAMCAALWTAKVITDEGTPRPDTELTACRLPNGVPAVFPQDRETNVCDGLGIATYELEPSP